MDSLVHLENAKRNGFNDIDKNPIDTLQLAETGQHFGMNLNWG